MIYQVAFSYPSGVFVIIVVYAQHRLIWITVVMMEKWEAVLVSHIRLLDCVNPAGATILLLWNQFGLFYHDAEAQTYLAY